MVDRSCIVIAVHNGSKEGGTAHAVKYGKKAGRIFWTYNPITKESDYNKPYFEMEGGDSRTSFMPVS